VLRVVKSWRFLGEASAAALSKVHACLSRARGAARRGRVPGRRWNGALRPEPRNCSAWAQRHFRAGGPPAFMDRTDPRPPCATLVTRILCDSDMRGSSWCLSLASPCRTRPLPPSSGRRGPTCSPGSHGTALGRMHVPRVGSPWLPAGVAAAGGHLEAPRASTPGSGAFASSRPSAATSRRPLPQRGGPGQTPVSVMVPDDDLVSKRVRASNLLPPSLVLVPRSMRAPWRRCGPHGRASVWLVPDPGPHGPHGRACWTPVEAGR
jgi:hypothetical protein